MKRNPPEEVIVPVVKKRRLSLSESDVMHLYELALEHFQDDPRCGCHQCINVKDKLEHFLGSVVSAKVRKLIRKNGYCNKLKKK